MKRLLLIYLVFCNTTIFAQNANNLPGNYHNQRGSILFIYGINPTTGAIIGGTYTTNTQPRQTFPVNGYVHFYVDGSDRVGALITFFVDFPHDKNITSWTGYITPSSANANVLTIHTVWHQVSAVATTPYNHITTDVDDFTR